MLINSRVSRRDNHLLPRNFRRLKTYLKLVQSLIGVKLKKDEFSWVAVKTAKLSHLCRG